MTDRRPRKRQAELPVKKIATVIALVAGGLLAMSYLLPALFDSESKPATQDSTETSPLPIPVSGGDPLTVGGGDSSQQSAQDNGSGGASSVAGVVKDWQPEAKVLPKSVESETITTESTHYEGRRVVISDEVVQKLMTDSKVSGALPTDVVAELTGKVQPVASGAAATDTTRVASGESVTAIPAATSGSVPLAVPAPKVELTPVATLAQKPRNHYSIQLMGASNTKAVDQFVAEHGLMGKVWVYQTKFRGSPWYVVLQGDYATSAQAKSAIRKLSPELLKGQPWPKSFAQIQKELKQ